MTKEKIINCLKGCGILLVKLPIPMFFFLLAIAFACFDKTTQMLTFTATGFLFVFMFFANDIKISSLKIAGLEIQIKELKDELNELRMVAKLSSEGMLNISKHLGCGYSSKIEKIKEKLYKESTSILKFSGIIFFVF